MKTSLFIANIVSAILILNFLIINPSITGFAVASQKLDIELTGAVGLAIIFIIMIIIMDIYFYLKAKKE